MRVEAEGESFDIEIRRVGMPEDRYAHLWPYLIWYAAGWLWHQALHRGKWYVEVVRKLTLKESVTQVIPSSFRWRSLPLPGRDAAATEAARVAALIERGSWPTAADGYRQR